MINYYYRSLKDDQVKELESFQSGCWVNVITNDTAELEKLAADLGADAGHLTDTIDQNEVPRVDTEGDQFYCFVRLPVIGKNVIKTTPVLFVFAANFIITVASEETELVKHLIADNSFYTTQKSKSFLIFLKYIFSQYQTALGIITKKVNIVFSRSGEVRNQDLINFVGFEEAVNELLSAIVPTREGLNYLKTRGLTYLHKEDNDLIEDAELIAGQIIVLLKNEMVTIKNMREAYSSVITNNLNRVVKLFTSLTVVLTIPTIVFSYYGMNVGLPFENNPHSAIIIAAITLTVVSVVILLLYHKKMI